MSDKTMKNNIKIGNDENDVDSCDINYHQSLKFDCITCDISLNIFDNHTDFNPQLLNCTSKLNLIPNQFELKCHSAPNESNMINHDQFISPHPTKNDSDSPAISPQHTCSPLLPTKPSDATPPTSVPFSKPISPLGSPSFDSMSHKNQFSKSLCFNHLLNSRPINKNSNSSTGGSSHTFESSGGAILDFCRSLNPNAVSACSSLPENSIHTDRRINNTAENDYLKSNNSKIVNLQHNHDKNFCNNFNTNKNSSSINSNCTQHSSNFPQAFSSPSKQDDSNSILPQCAPILGTIPASVQESAITMSGHNSSSSQAKIQPQHHTHHHSAISEPHFHFKSNTVAFEGSSPLNPMPNTHQHPDRQYQLLPPRDRLTQTNKGDMNISHDSEHNHAAKMAKYLSMHDQLSKTDNENHSELRYNSQQSISLIPSLNVDAIQVKKRFGYESHFNSSIHSYFPKLDRKSYVTPLPSKNISSSMYDDGIISDGNDSDEDVDDDEYDSDDDDDDDEYDEDDNEEDDTDEHDNEYRHSNSTSSSINHLTSGSQNKLSRYSILADHNAHHADIELSDNDSRMRQRPIDANLEDSFDSLDYHHNHHHSRAISTHHVNFAKKNVQTASLVQDSLLTRSKDYLLNERAQLATANLKKSRRSLVTRRDLLDESLLGSSTTQEADFEAFSPPSKTYLACPVEERMDMKYEADPSKNAKSSDTFFFSEREYADAEILRKSPENTSLHLLFDGSAVDDIGNITQDVESRDLKGKLDVMDPTSRNNDFSPSARSIQPMPNCTPVLSNVEPNVNFKSCSSHVSERKSPYQDDFSSRYINPVGSNNNNNQISGLPNDSTTNNASVTNNNNNNNNTHKHSISFSPGIQTESPTPLPHLSSALLLPRLLFMPVDLDTLKMRTAAPDAIQGEGLDTVRQGGATVARIVDFDGNGSDRTVSGIASDSDGDGVSICALSEIGLEVGADELDAVELVARENAQLGVVESGGEGDIEEDEKNLIKGKSSIKAENTTLDTDAHMNSNNNNNSNNHNNNINNNHIKKNGHVNFGSPKNSTAFNREDTSIPHRVFENNLSSHEMNLQISDLSLGGLSGGMIHLSVNSTADFNTQFNAFLNNNINNKNIANNNNDKSNNIDYNTVAPSSSFSTPYQEVNCLLEPNYQLYQFNQQEQHFTDECFNTASEDEKDVMIQQLNNPDFDEDDIESICNNSTVKAPSVYSSAYASGIIKQNCMINKTNQQLNNNNFFVNSTSIASFASFSLDEPYFWLNAPINPTSTTNLDDNNNIATISNKNISSAAEVAAATLACTQVTSLYPTDDDECTKISNDKVPPQSTRFSSIPNFESVSQITPKSFISNNINNNNNNTHNAASSSVNAPRVPVGSMSVQDLTRHRRHYSRLHWSTLQQQQHLAAKIQSQIVNHSSTANLSSDNNTFATVAGPPIIESNIKPSSNVNLNQPISSSQLNPDFSKPNDHDNNSKSQVQQMISIVSTRPPPILPPPINKYFPTSLSNLPHVTSSPISPTVLSPTPSKSSPKHGMGGTMPSRTQLVSTLREAFAEDILSEEKFEKREYSGSEYSGGGNSVYMTAKSNLPSPIYTSSNHHQFISKRSLVTATLSGQVTPVNRSRNSTAATNKKDGILFNGIMSAPVIASNNHSDQTEQDLYHQKIKFTTETSSAPPLDDKTNTVSDPMMHNPSSISPSPVIDYNIIDSSKVANVFSIFNLPTNNNGRNSFLINRNEKNDAVGEDTIDFSSLKTSPLPITNIIDDVHNIRINNSNQKNSVCFGNSCDSKQLQNTTPFVDSLLAESVIIHASHTSTQDDENSNSHLVKDDKKQPSLIHYSSSAPSDVDDLIISQDTNHDRNDITNNGNPLSIFHDIHTKKRKSIGWDDDLSLKDNNTIPCLTSNHLDHSLNIDVQVKEDVLNCVAVTNKFSVEHDSCFDNSNLQSSGLMIEHSHEHTTDEAFSTVDQFSRRFLEDNHEEKLKIIDHSSTIKQNQTNSNNNAETFCQLCAKQKFHNSQSFSTRDVNSESNKIDHSHSKIVNASDHLIPKKNHRKQKKNKINNNENLDKVIHSPVNDSNNFMSKKSPNFSSRFIELMPVHQHHWTPESHMPNLNFHHSTSHVSNHVDVKLETTRFFTNQMAPASRAFQLQNSRALIQKKNVQRHVDQQLGPTELNVISEPTTDLTFQNINEVQVNNLNLDHQLIDDHAKFSAPSAPTKTRKKRQHKTIEGLKATLSNPGSVDAISTYHMDKINSFIIDEKKTTIDKNPSLPSLENQFRFRRHSFPSLLNYAAYSDDYFLKFAHSSHTITSEGNFKNKSYLQNQKASQKTRLPSNIKRLKNNERKIKSKSRRLSSTLVSSSSHSAVSTPFLLNSVSGGGHNQLVSNNNYVSSAHNDEVDVCNTIESNLLFLPVSALEMQTEQQAENFPLTFLTEQHAHALSLNIEELFSTNEVLDDTTTDALQMNEDNTKMDILYNTPLPVTNRPLLSSPPIDTNTFSENVLDKVDVASQKNFVVSNVHFSANTDNDNNNNNNNNIVSSVSFSSNSSYKSKLLNPKHTNSITINSNNNKLLSVKNSKLSPVFAPIPIKRFHSDIPILPSSSQNASSPILTSKYSPTFLKQNHFQHDNDLKKNYYGKNSVVAHPAALKLRKSSLLYVNDDEIGHNENNLIFSGTRGSRNSSLINNQSISISHPHTDNNNSIKKTSKGAKTGFQNPNDSVIKKAFVPHAQRTNNMVKSKVFDNSLDISHNNNNDDARALFHSYHVDGQVNNRFIVGNNQIVVKSNENGKHTFDSSNNNHHHHIHHTSPLKLINLKHHLHRHSYNHVPPHSSDAIPNDASLPLSTVHAGTALKRRKLMSGAQRRQIRRRFKELNQIQKMEEEEPQVHLNKVNEVLENVWTHSINKPKWLLPVDEENLELGKIIETDSSNELPNDAFKINNVPYSIPPDIPVININPFVNSDTNVEWPSNVEWPPSPDNTILLSNEQQYACIKKLNYILRHGALALGLRIREDGFVVVDELLALSRLEGLSVSRICEVVRTCHKKRYELKEEMINGVRSLMIRAAQGHTIRNIRAELLLRRISDFREIPKCLHGTYFTNWLGIRQVGLHRMRRNHIHFAMGLPEDEGVSSSMRRTSEVVIYLDVRAAMRDGIEFLLSSNGVILSSGSQGLISPAYFASVWHLEWGVELWEDGRDVTHRFLDRSDYPLSLLSMTAKELMKRELEAEAAAVASFAQQHTSGSSALAIEEIDGGTFQKMGDNDIQKHQKMKISGNRLNALTGLQEIAGG